MAKSLLSKFTKRLKTSYKKILLFLISAFFRGSKSYTFFGIANGLISFDKEKVEIHPAYSFQLTPPQTVHPQLDPRFESPFEILPEEGIVAIPQAIAVNQGTVLQKGKLVTTYYFAHEGRSPRESDLFQIRGRRCFPKIFHSKQPVIACASSWQGAFFHWIYETLPKLGFIEEHVLASTPLFIETQHAFQRESLELLGINLKSVIDASQYDGVEAPQILFPSTPAAPSPISVNYLQKALNPKLTEDKAYKRLYISRKDATRRRIVNEDEVIDCLKPLGFNVVEFSALPLIEQMNLFYSADIVIAPHGAALSLLAFCKPGSSILEIFAPKYLNTCYWRLSNYAKLHYTYLFGKSVGDAQDPDIFVDLIDFQSSLKKLGL